MTEHEAFMSRIARLFPGAKVLEERRYEDIRNDVLGVLGPACQHVDELVKLEHLLRLLVAIAEHVLQTTPHALCWVERMMDEAEARWHWVAERRRR